MNLYVDDTGSVKGLPHNARATGVAAACGQPAVDVRGDAFLARVVDCDEAFERLDFTLAEVDSGAPWVAQAARRSAARRAGAGASAARLRGLLPPGAAEVTVGGGGAGGDGGEGGGGGAAVRDADAQQRPAPGKPYTLSQDGEAVVLELAVPAGTRARDVAFSAKVGSLRLEVATLQPPASRVVLDGEPFGPLAPADCSWSLADDASAANGGRLLTLTLAKAKPLRWLGVLRSG